jgi:hypothetical protein
MPINIIIKKIHTYIDTHTHTYIHTYIRTYIHAYIHTYIYYVYTERYVINCTFPLHALC